jgi:hypothetical protein
VERAIGQSFVMAATSFNTNNIGTFRSVAIYLLEVELMKATASGKKLHKDRSAQYPSGGFLCPMRFFNPAFLCRPGKEMQHAKRFLRHVA